MTQLLRIHPTHPQIRLIKKAADVINHGGVIAYPTDSAYALGCCIGNYEGVERIRTIRKINNKHNLTLVCKDLSEIAVYAQVNNVCYRFLKANTPGPYTFILQGTREVSKKLMHPKRKTIGIRIPDCSITQKLLQYQNGPIISTTLHLPDDELPITDPDNIQKALTNQIDLLIDGGYCESIPTTVIDFTKGIPHILRIGKGPVNHITTS